MDRKPLEDTSDIRIVENNSINNQVLSTSYLKKDPEGVLNSRTYRIITREKKFKFFSMSFWLIILLTSILVITFLSLSQQNIIQQNFVTSYTGYYVLFGITLIFSLFYTTKAIIEFMGWKSAVARMRESYANGDSSAKVLFHTTYRNISIRSVRILWAVIFIEVFYGLFILITFLLYNYFVLKNNNLILDINMLNITVEWNIRNMLNNWYNNNIELFLILSLIFLGLVLAIYFIFFTFDKKRLLEISGLLGDDYSQITSSVMEAKSKEHKLWIKVFIVSFFLIYLLPFLIILILVWRKVIRRKA
ncbi:MSC_0882 family membrane protein [Mycoplasma anserisalpingitidis]|uniref:Uncharacterized protein n=1 Tax=Mycoplasma anserisalpingitidis TaxID=519450 RepID=A0A5B8KAN4_9MOLU|nr:hypothetical protein [Mycoplasma anserisalpingitidis]QDY88634.1 hypothetical protein FOY43_03150 [Mycoplasma anserisalpingitidis]